MAQVMLAENPARGAHSLRLFFAQPRVAELNQHLLRFTAHARFLKGRGIWKEAGMRLKSCIRVQGKKKLHQSLAVVDPPAKSVFLLLFVLLFFFLGGGLVENRVISTKKLKSKDPLPKSSPESCHLLKPGAKLQGLGPLPGRVVAKRVGSLPLGHRSW